MMAPDTGENLGRLHERTREFASAITGSNRLPEGFPREEMCLVAQALCELNDADRPEDRQVLVHAQAKLRETRRVLRGAAAEEMSFFELERSHHALFAEIDAVLERVPAAELVPLQPATDEPPLVVRRADIEAKVAAEVQRVVALGAAGRSVTVIIQNIQKVDQSRHTHFSLFRDLRITLEGLVKVAASFRAELAGHLINLPWVRHLTDRVVALTEALGKAIEALKRAADDLPELVRGIEQVRRLAERVVRGGIALFKLIKRMLGRRGGERSPRPGRIFRDIDAPWSEEVLLSFTNDDEHVHKRHPDGGPSHAIRAKVETQRYLRSALPILQDISRLQVGTWYNLNGGNRMPLSWVGLGPRSYQSLNFASRNYFVVLNYYESERRLEVRSSATLPSFVEQKALPIGRYKLEIEVEHEGGIACAATFIVDWFGDIETLRIERQGSR